MIRMFSTIFQKRYFSLGVLVALLVLAGCKGDDSPTPNPNPDPELTAQQERAQSMAGTWVSNEVLEAPGDTEDAALQELQSLELTFEVTQEQNPSGFDAANADTYFNAGDDATWAWADANTLALVNLNAVGPVSEFTIAAFDGSSLTISFTFDGPSTSRVEGIGAYRVQLNKQQ